MKLYIIFILFFTLSLSVQGQVINDSKKKSVTLPPVENSKETPESFAEQPKELDDYKGITSPKVTKDLSLPKKEFSMFPDEQFGDPGEQYIKQINKNIEDLKLTPEEVEQKNGSSTDQYFGDFKSNAAYVNVVYRDHGYVDGDIIQVRVNDDVIHPRVFLTGGFKGFKLDLQSGFNKIDFVALNQGSSGPNTAEFKVVDDKGNLVSQNRWNLSTGVKATIIVMKD
ncbi:hypothetical protein APS56_03535 [Pseudalgibacter alginicilyticus]|uniref:Secreted protein n=1 Tax=Pseudalgibacter alginicilyticus TaxID=1736674 RepID=A0A0P0CE74_9FLAO|nr:hypothetical protein [Pseudalgibacter alginicilyticus]ALJ04267.1 hypothetical protein APS56_03535 [Pseudalgibacter alginicilyticus]